MPIHPFNASGRRFVAVAPFGRAAVIGPMLMMFVLFAAPASSQHSGLQIGIAPVLGFNLQMAGYSKGYGRQNLSATTGLFVPKNHYLGIGIAANLDNRLFCTLRFAATALSDGIKYRYAGMGGSSTDGRISQGFDYQAIDLVNEVKLFSPLHARAPLTMNVNAVLGLQYAWIPGHSRVDGLGHFASAGSVGEVSEHSSYRQLRYRTASVMAGFDLFFRYRRSPALQLSGMYYYTPQPFAEFYHEIDYLHSGTTDRFHTIVAHHGLLFTAAVPVYLLRFKD